MKKMLRAALVLIFASSAGAAVGQNQLDTDGGFVTMHDIPRLLTALKSTGTNGSFWVVLVPNTAQNDGLSANLQFSIEDGRLGLDWVLIAQRNIEDKEQFAGIVRRSGCSYTTHEMNNVTYLRVTDSKDFSELAKSILTELYGVSPNQPLKLIITGFEWPRNLTGRST